MKQTFYLHQYESGDMFLSTREEYVHVKAVGTIELDVMPIQKEVEKVIDKPFITGFADDMAVWKFIPKDAYDVKVVYKIKE
jgi:hypothetical protein